MPDDDYSSDESDRGAPLRPPLVTPTAPTASTAPTAPTQLRHDVTKPDSPSDEEKALVRASADFGSLKDPFAETPGVPQSIPPNAYSHRMAFPQPTPSRPNNVFNRFGNNQSASRYRSSAAGASNSAPRFRTGVAGATLPTGNSLPDEVSYWVHST